MNELQRGILTMLKSAVTGEAGVLPAGFSLDEAMPMIRRHHLQVLIYEGALRCGIPDTAPQMIHLFRVYCKHMLRSEAQMKAVERLYAAFEAHGIDYMPLKGCNMKALYPRPELRMMGDADILIRTEQYDRIRPAAAALGLTEQQETDHEYVWDSEALHLELHKRLISTSNPDYYGYFGNGWRLARKQDGFRYAMNAEDGFIYQFVHYAKHYRNGGIGCRHITDLWVYLRAYPDMDASYIRAELEKLQLLAFYENTRRLIAFWFEGGESCSRTEFMSDFIFDSGSWGRWKNHILSAQIRNINSSGSHRRATTRNIRQWLFPAREIMIGRYPVLQKAPWLLPVMWPVRWADALLFRRANVRRVRKELRTASADNVEAYQQALDYVGLAFRFDA